MVEIIWSWWLTPWTTTHLLKMYTPNDLQATKSRCGCECNYYSTKISWIKWLPIKKISISIATEKHTITQTPTNVCYSNILCKIVATCIHICWEGQALTSSKLDFTGIIFYNYASAQEVPFYFHFSVPEILYLNVFSQFLRTNCKINPSKY